MATTKTRSDAQAWEQIAGPVTDYTNGTFTDRLKVPGGWIYRVDEVVTGGTTGKLAHRCIAFVPDPADTDRRWAEAGRAGFRKP